jgi:hypothetical protein
MISTPVTAAIGSIIDARSGCDATAEVLEEVDRVGMVGLTLVCIPCNISLVPSFLVEIGTRIVSEQPGH